MTASVLPRHGGDLSAAATMFGRIPWLDLSTGINPRPYPVSAGSVDEWNCLPTAHQRQTLCTAAARYYGAGPETTVVVAPGTQSLIQWLPYLACRPGDSRRVAVVTPTYAEHAAAWQAAGHQVTNVGTLSDITAIKADVAIVVNPNNPDGRLFDPEQLCNIARKLSLLIVDEAFADVQSDISLVVRLGHLTAHADSGRVVILRSFGKFFGLAGVRLGFALLTESTLATRLQETLGPWAVGGAALRLGTIALSDDSWISATKNWLHITATRLDSVLTAAGLVVTGGTDLFRLVDCGTACSTIYEKLGQAGILVRAFTSLPSHLRFGLPGSMPEWQRLTEILLSLSLRPKTVHKSLKKSLKVPRDAIYRRY